MMSPIQPQLKKKIKIKLDKVEIKMQKEFLLDNSI